jgi:calcium permeable stress-gated cation channel
VQVDTINWARLRLKDLNVEVRNEQRNPDAYPESNSAFIQFNTQLAAHMACQCVTSHKPMFLTPRFLETAPEDVVWGNMQLSWWQRLLRVYVINTLLFGLIIFYAIPTAFVGSISNITYLTNELPFLNFIYDLPDQLLGVITGLLPAVMLAVWLSLIPFILRLACSFQGYPTRTLIELAVQNLYFVFLVVQLFLVVSIASSTTAVITQIMANPTSVANILATNLPKASNFFFSYLLLQGLSVSAAVLLQVVILLLYYGFKGLDKTPREKWKRFNTLPGLGWGTTYPVFTNLAVIGRFQLYVC